jgi:hypothetical protein
VSTIQDAHSKLIAALAVIKPKSLPTYPEAEDVLALNEHLQAVALAVDGYVLEIGKEAKSNSRNGFDLSLFIAPLSNMIQGNATYELECLAQAWADENAEYDDARYEGVG